MLNTSQLNMWKQNQLELTHVGVQKVIFQRELTHANLTLAWVNICRDILVISLRNKQNRKEQFSSFWVVHSSNLITMQSLLSSKKECNFEPLEPEG